METDFSLQKPSENAKQVQGLSACTLLTMGPGSHCELG